MNERIKEFLSETKIYDGSKTQAIITCPADLEKFAQLIVQECIDTAFHRGHPDLEFLLKHFGVEE